MVWALDVLDAAVLRQERRRGELSLSTDTRHRAQVQQEQMACAFLITHVLRMRKQRDAEEGAWRPLCLPALPEAAEKLIRDVQ